MDSGDGFCVYSLLKLTIKSYGSFQELQYVLHLRILLVTKQRIDKHGFEGGNVLNLKYSNHKYSSCLKELQDLPVLGNNTVFVLLTVQC